MATKSETERALAEIRKCVEHAGEILARDHHRPELGGGGWAFDFGALEYTVGSIRDVLDKLDEATRSASGDGRVVKSRRRNLLEELRDKANAENAARDSVTRSSETPVPSELDRMATEALAAHARGETIALPTRSTSGRRET